MSAGSDNGEVLAIRVDFVDFEVAERDAADDRGGVRVFTVLQLVSLEHEEATFPYLKREKTWVER